MQFVVDEKCWRTGELFSRNVFTTIFTEKSQTQLLIIPRPLCGWSNCYEWIYNPNYSLQCVTLCIFPVNLTKWPHNYLPTATWSSPRRSTSAAQVHSLLLLCPEPENILRDTWKIFYCPQNQNDEAPHRMTKSSSWFSSLTRRASRLSSLSSLQTPAQKRSLDMRSPGDKQLLPSSNRPRLNK